MIIPEWLHVGVYLHTSCNDEWWGPVTFIGKDPNGRDVVDFEFDSEQLDEFVDNGTDVEKGVISLAQIHVPEGRCKLTAVPIEECSVYQDRVNFLTLETPGNGCFRCSKLFSVHERKGER